MRHEIDSTSNWPLLIAEQWRPLTALIAGLVLFNWVVSRLTGNASISYGSMIPFVLLIFIAGVAPILMEK